MKLIKPYYEILKCPKLSDLLLIEKAGRVCYKSEDQICDLSYETMLSNLLDRGHESVLEHSQITVRFVCDRGVSHELVRHRLASFSQESTRYCNYSKDKFNNEITFIIPCWLQDKFSEGEYTLQYINNLREIETGLVFPYITWLQNLHDSERAYFELLEDAWTPEQARAVLPNALKTEIVMTANIREWRHILKLRTSKKAHPQMRELMLPLLKELKEKVTIVFDDIEVS